MVLKRLHGLGIRRENIKDMIREVPRLIAKAPYGHRVVDGKLVEDRREMQVARLIVDLHWRQNLAWNEVIRCLNKEGLHTRQGLPWKQGTARMVFVRWRGKI